MFSIIKFDNLNSLYSSSASDRYNNILSIFEKRYGSKPDFIARAPGRVNIIGEHIDYEGYGVLPAAIEKDCLIAVKRTNSKEIKLGHVL
jgi:galactokinase